MTTLKKLKSSCSKKLLCLLLASVMSSAAGSYATAGNNPDDVGYSNTTQQQTKRITGTVTDESGLPIIGASVYVKGTSIGTTTDVDGKYSITVPANSKISFDFLGYTGKEVTVGTKTTMDVVLVENATTLSEVEVTGEYGLKRNARALGTSAQNIKAADVIESGRDNFITALESRVAGLNVVSSGGTPGASTSVSLRGASSISGNNAPLFVIDGVPVNNSSFNPLDFADPAQAISARALDFSSRGNDFNPEDIESITVLKGAGAAALYGSDASGGAIVITTRKGSSGKGKVSYSNQFRWESAYGYPEVQTKYANGAYGTTNRYYYRHFGGYFPEGTQFYDNIGAVLQTGFSQKHNVSLEAGNEKNTIRLSASYLDQKGVVKTTDMTRTNISLSGKAEITKWMRFEGTMQYAPSTNTKTYRGSSSPVYRAYLWPVDDNMLNYMDPDGKHMSIPNLYTDGDLLNPLFGLYKNKNYDEAENFMTSLSLTVTPVANFFVRTQLGWNIIMAKYETANHPYYDAYQDSEGSINISEEVRSDPSLAIIAGYSNHFMEEKFSLSAQAGYRQQENAVKRLSTYGTNFAVKDFLSINNCDPATIVSSTSTPIARRQNIFGSVELGYNDIVFLTARGTNEWSSTLPKKNNSYFYPSLEGSLIVSDLLFKTSQQINYLKLRAAVSQVGKDTGPQQIQPALQQTGLSGGGYMYGYTGPNPNLVPEMKTEWEVGFETRLFGSRLFADFTYYNKHLANQIVRDFRLSYATGFVLNTLNIGSFDAWGWELVVNGDILKNFYGLTWNVGINASHFGSELTYLPENVSEYYDAYTWNSGNIRDGKMKGYPITTVTGRAYMRNDKGDILINPATGLPLISDTWSVLGDREPKLRFGINTSMQFKNFYFSAMFQGRYKALVVNGTKRTMMDSGASWESVDLRERKPVIFNGVLRDGYENTDTPTKNTISISYDDFGQLTYTGADEDWIDDNVHYLRLRELQLSYNVPSKYLKNFVNGLFSRVAVFVQANDLMTWTNYTGIDAVGNTLSAAAGGVGGEGYDVWAIPNPRSYAFGIRVSF
jgi:TonB-linked SusC/RagA family outer membrane protein